MSMYGFDGGQQARKSQWEDTWFTKPSRGDKCITLKTYKSPYNTGEMASSIVTRTYPEFPCFTRLFHYVIHYAFLVTSFNSYPIGHDSSAKVSPEK